MQAAERAQLLTMHFKCGSAASLPAGERRKKSRMQIAKRARRWCVQMQTHDDMFLRKVNSIIDAFGPPLRLQPNSALFLSFRSFIFRRLLSINHRHEGRMKNRTPKSHNRLSPIRGPQRKQIKRISRPVDRFLNIQRASERRNARGKCFRGRRSVRYRLKSHPSMGLMDCGRHCARIRSYLSSGIIVCR